MNTLPLLGRHAVVCFHVLKVILPKKVTDLNDRFFVIFFSPSIQILGYGHDRFLPDPFRFIYHATTRPNAVSMGNDDIGNTPPRQHTHTHRERRGVAKRYGAVSRNLIEFATGNVTPCREDTGV
jgi:hypothetical protein